MSGALGTVSFLLSPQKRSAIIVETKKAIGPISDGIVRGNKRIHWVCRTEFIQGNQRARVIPGRAEEGLSEALQRGPWPHTVGTSPEKTRLSRHCWRLLRHTEPEPGAPHLFSWKAEFLGHHLARRSASRCAATFSRHSVLNRRLPWLCRICRTLQVTFQKARESSNVHPIRKAGLKAGELSEM